MSDDFVLDNFEGDDGASLGPDWARVESAPWVRASPLHPPDVAMVGAICPECSAVVGYIGMKQGGHCVVEAKFRCQCEAEFWTRAAQ